jgi:hypothetical protein
MVRRAAALLVKAAAAAASGKLLPSYARIARVWRRRKTPSLLLPQMAWELFLCLLPAVELLILLAVGAGKQHARVRSSSRLI